MKGRAVVSYLQTLSNHDSNMVYLVLCLGRLITNTTYADMHQVAFTAYFQLAGDRAKKPVKWQHLHGEGFYGTTIDMCSKQMSGMSINR